MEQLTAHPFVHEMAAGTLPLEKFQHYIEQNLLYLPQYSRALALGAAKSRDDDELRSFAALARQHRRHRDPPEPPVVRAGARADRHDGAEGERDGAGRAQLHVVPARDRRCRDARRDPRAGHAVRVELRGHRKAARPKMVEHPVYSDWISFFATDDYDALVTRLRRELDDRAAELGAADKHAWGTSSTPRCGWRRGSGTWRTTCSTGTTNERRSPADQTSVLIDVDQLAAPELVGQHAVDVLAHLPLGRIGVGPPDRRRDAAVLLDRPGQPAGDLDRQPSDPALVALEVLDEVVDPAVGRLPVDDLVEFARTGAPRLGELRRSQARNARGDVLLQLASELVSGLQCRHPRARALHQLAHLVELPEVLVRVPATTAPLYGTSTSSRSFSSRTNASRTGVLLTPSRRRDVVLAQGGTDTWNSPAMIASRR